ncbi:MAG: sugar ABC transporter substrate-binding protein [Lachnospiraceae bacterium]|nr:sugar ABC transporter substrate-binding protein [Lachnospiraceae bacterium]
MSKRVISICLIIIFLAGLAKHAFVDFDAEKSDSTLAQRIVEKNEVSDDTLVMWYTDPSMEEYISDVVLSYRQETGMDVQMVLVDGIDYLEKINNASVRGEGDCPAPDLYVTTHDNLMKAYLAGLASPIIDKEEKVVEDHFPGTALHAISCDGKLVAYPLYYETNFFLYNKTYMSSIAQSRIEDEADTKAGEQAQAEADNMADEKSQAESKDTTSEEESEADYDSDGENADIDEYDEPYGEEDEVAEQELLDRLATMIPSTIDDITTFANNYDAPEQVEAVFKWDVRDIFYNYFFVGNYMEVGGEDGDNNAIFNLYNQQAVECLSTYQGMNKYFTIEEEDNYDSILQQFIDGKLVFTIATTDAFAKIQQAQMEGKFDYEYGVAVIPDVNKLLLSRGLSVTDVVAVNGYSEKKEAANDFASRLSYDNSDSLYMKAGKLACKRDILYENSEINNVMTEYQKSMPLPKMIETSDFWLQLEIAFSKVYAGDDPDEVLRELSDTMGGQIEEITYSIPIQESIGAGVQTFFTK